jgi:Tfp pilus assembly protein PilN
MSAAWNFATRPFRDERPVLATVAVCVLAGLLLFAANLNLYWTFSRQVIGTRREIASLEARKARAEKASEQSRAALNGYKLSSLAEESAGLQTIVRERRFSWLALLARLEKTLPPDVRLSRLSPHFDSPEAVALDLSVLGKTGDSVVHAIAALSKDPAFSDVELHAESSPDKGEPEGYTFSISMRYVPLESR